MRKILVTLLVALLFAGTAIADPTVSQLMGVGFSAEKASMIATFQAGTYANNTYLVCDNQADTATINVLKCDTADDTVLNSSASDDIVLQLEDDASRRILFDAASDSALAMKFGDAGTTATQQLTVSANTSDADDDSSLRLAGGGAFGTDGTRGATIVLPGEEVSGGSDITYNAGAADTHIFQVAGTSEVLIADDGIQMAATDASVNADTTDGSDGQTVNVCGGGGDAACNAEGRGAWLTLEGSDVGGAGVGGAVNLEGGAGDGTADVTIATNHDDADVIIAGGTTQATRVTIEGDTGDTTLATGNLAIGTDAKGLVTDTADASDNQTLIVAAASATGETRGAWISLEGADVGGAGVGGAVNIEGAAGDATADVTIATNHDDADILLRGGTTQATRVTIEGDTGNVVATAGITSTATTTIGWSVVSGADTACTSTCTSACVFGVNTASLTADIVDCADATADECLCAGAS